MICSVCLNPCIDRTVEIDAFAYGGLNRIRASRSDGCGKGVNVALVPLGTPLLAGPGSIVAVMVAVGQAGTNVGSWIAVIVAVVLAHVVMWLTMRFSLVVSRFLGPGGIMLLTKISGLLLAAIATQLIMEGIFQFIAAAHLG